MGGVGRRMQMGELAREFRADENTQIQSKMYTDIVLKQSASCRHELVVNFSLPFLSFCLSSCWFNTILASDDKKLPKNSPP